MRMGIGYDVHRLVAERKLIIGGVEVPHQLGLAGHSDADVLVHAIMDALLGALGAGDIGKHFPDTDSQYAGISSLTLLERVKKLIDENGYTINNVDSIIIAEKPKMAPYIPSMRKKLAHILLIDESQMNIKATTTEKLGFVGKGEGIAAQAVCLLKKQKRYRRRCQWNKYE